MEKYTENKTVSPDSIVLFGRYPQNADGSDNAQIEWRVLEKRDGKALLLSEKCIDCIPYNDCNENTTWGNCSLRQWLNRNFLETAFSTEEQTKIQETKIVAGGNPYSCADPGDDTNDKIFLLSVDEAEHYFDGREARKTLPTDYAKAKGAGLLNKYTKNGLPTCRWWLRSPGFRQRYAAGVHNAGNINECGDYANLTDWCVRPAIWVKL